MGGYGRLVRRLRLPPHQSYLRQRRLCGLPRRGPALRLL